MSGRPTGIFIDNEECNRLMELWRYYLVLGSDDGGSIEWIIRRADYLAYYSYLKFKYGFKPEDIITFNCGTGSIDIGSPTFDRDFAMGCPNCGVKFKNIEELFAHED